MRHAFPAIIFDLDGTLVDTRDHILHAFNASLRHHGSPPMTRHQLAVYAGKPLSFVYEAVTGVKDEATIRELCAMHKYWQIDHIDLVKAFPGLDDVIAGLAAKDVKWGIATARYRESTEMIVKYVGLDKYHVPVTCGDDGYPEKPDPALFVQVAKELSVDPAKCLVVGDGVNDIMAGKAMRAKTAWAKYGYGGSEPLPEPADWTLHHLSDVLQYA